MIMWKRITDPDVIRYLNGLYSHISSDSIIIGGLAIDIFLSANVSTDIDIIGRKYNYSRRIEITKSNDIYEHFNNATLSIEQIGIIKRGPNYYLIFTKNAQRTLQTGIIYVLKSQLTPREKVRALFKSQVYHMPLNIHISLTDEEKYREQQLITRYRYRGFNPDDNV